MYQVTFLLFSPIKGSMLKGVVQKISQDHIGLLCYNTFNASIPREYIHNSLTYDEYQGHWASQAKYKNDYNAGSSSKRNAGKLLILIKCICMYN